MAMFSLCRKDNGVKQVMAGAGGSDATFATAMTDLMTSLAVIFILLLVVYLNRSFQETKEGSQNNLVAIKQALDKRLTLQHITCEYDAKKDPLSCTIRVGGDKLQFDANQASLKPQGKAFLAFLTPQLTGVLCAKPNQKNVESVFIQGFTDSDGNDEENLQLSQQRAFSVMQYVLNSTQLAPTQRGCLLDLSSTNGRGRRELLRNSQGHENKAASRRVEFKIRVKSFELRKQLDEQTVAQ
jgi:outer membrane protein OmpA-like peptidoglycan-associated protein